MPRLRSFTYKAIQFFTVAWCAIGLLVPVAEAQNYPSRPVRLIVPAAPGGNPDILGRMLADKLTAALGQPFLVENAAGAGGIVAAELVTKQPPDGYTLMLGDSGGLAVNPALNPKLGYKVPQDFTLITALAAVPTVLVVPPSLPGTMKEFIAQAKAQPGKWAHGSAGNGSIHHLTWAIFAGRTGLELLHVPYRGGTAMVKGLLSGEIQAGWSGVPNVQQAIDAGQLHALAVSTDQRLKALPNVPTVKELGITDKFDIATVIGLQGPAGMPADIVAKLQGAVAKALREPDLAERMERLAMILRENGTKAYEQAVQGELKDYAEAVKLAGVKNE
jgi:tripartite-type tricarboxylate transporter receptor subunit TctC